MNESGDQPIFVGTVSNNYLPIARDLRSALSKLVACFEKTHVSADKEEYAALTEATRVLSNSADLPDA